jgi:hypothetical protein
VIDLLGKQEGVESMLHEVAVSVKQIFECVLGCSVYLFGNNLFLPA